MDHIQNKRSRTRKIKLRTGAVVQVVEHLSSNCEALASNPSVANKQNKVAGCQWFMPLNPPPGGKDQEYHI
jgi:hypothetical protein